MAFMRDAFGYSAQDMADKYEESKAMVIELWQIATLPDSVAQATSLSPKHLYQISKLVSRKNHNPESSTALSPLAFALAFRTSMDSI